MAFRSIFAVATAVFVGGLGLAAVQPDTSLAVPAASVLPVTTTPLPFNRDDPAQDRVGDLLFMGAVQIRSSNPLFGGISALRSGLGDRMLAVSDTGNWLAFDTVERDGRLIGIANARIAPIRQPDGKAAATKADGDAEALEWDPATGAATIVYEQDHRLVHFTGIDAARTASFAAIPSRIERLAGMAGWAPNGGGEALAVLPGGARIVISETALRPDGSHQALLTEAGITTEIGIAGVADHSPTDAIALDSHRLLVLNRRFTLTMGQGAALTLVDLTPALGPSPLRSMLGARVLARWQPPLTLDNMEGLALRRRGNKTFVYVISDDNLNGLQRTVLMKFALCIGE